MGRECYIKTKDGRILTILKNTDYMRDPRGNVVGVIESFENISARKRLEEELRESRITLTRSSTPWRIRYL